jgi:hypothetical protein
MCRDRQAALCRYRIRFVTSRRSSRGLDLLRPCVSLIRGDRTRIERLAVIEGRDRRQPCLTVDRRPTLGSSCAADALVGGPDCTRCDRFHGKAATPAFRSVGNSSNARPRTQRVPEVQMLPTFLARLLSAGGANRRGYVLALLGRRQNGFQTERL